MSDRSKASNPATDAVTQRILRALDGIHYGSVEITIHDSQVVQIERKEKLRFEVTGNSRNGQ